MCYMINTTVKFDFAIFKPRMFNSECIKIYHLFCLSTCFELCVFSLYNLSVAFGDSAHKPWIKTLNYINNIKIDWTGLYHYFTWKFNIEYVKYIVYINIINYIIQKPQHLQEQILHIAGYFSLNVFKWFISSLINSQSD